MNRTGKRILSLALVLALFLVPVLGMEVAAETVTESTGRLYGIATSGGVCAVTFELDVKASVSVLCSYSAGLSNVWVAKDGSSIALTPRSTYSGSGNFGNTYEYDVQHFYDLNPGTYHVWVAPHKNLARTLYWVKVDAVYEVTPHTHNYNQTKVIAPTCSERGYTKHTCDCGASYKDNYKDKLPHTEVYSAEIPANCLETGKAAGSYCSVCNAIISGCEVLPRTGHAYVNNTCTYCGLATGSCGYNLTWELDTNGNLTITGAGNMFSYQKDGAPWYNVSDSITSVKLPTGLLSIGSFAFQRSKISSITIPATVKNIGEGAFYGCDELTQVVIPDSVDSIGEYAFYVCENLEKVVMPKSITSLSDGIFSGCQSLAQIDIPEDIESIGKNAFANCADLIEIIIPEAVATIGQRAFSNCTGITKITMVGDAPTFGDNVFNYITAIVHYNDSYSSWNDIVTRNYGGTITWSNEHSYQEHKTSHTCTEQGYTAHTCICGAQYIDSYVEPSHQISGDICSRCGKAGTCGDDLAWEFDDNTGILTISGSGSMKTYGKESYNRPPWYSLREAVSGVVVEDGATSIGAYAFSNLTSLNSAELPEGLKTIGSYAFHCSGLREISIPDSVTTIGDWAFGETKLTEVSISENVTNGGEGIFAGCNDLRKATVASTRTFDDMFLWCNHLTDVVLTDNVKILGAGTFCDCYGLTELVLPNGLTRIEGVKQVQPNSNVTRVGNTFRNCGFAAITIPETVTYIGTGAFENCTKLTSIIIPASVIAVSDIFPNCTSLKTVYFQGDDCLNSFYLFENVTATAYYPAAYAQNWQSAIKLYDWGKNLTWVKYNPCAEHSYGEWERISDSDCTSPGLESSNCGGCKVIRYRSIGALGHNWDAATCTTPKTCKTCLTTDGKATSHVYDQEKVDPKYLVSEATSTEQAVYKMSCVCGKAGTDTFKYGALKPQEYKDVPTNAYYYDPVMWAVENGITTGTGDGTTFEPNAICTRGQVVTFLWRAAGKPEPNTTENPFVDVKTSDYFYKAVLWAKEKNITSGTGDGSTFEPNANCTRAQIVTFLNRAKNGQATTNDNPFSDVPTGSYYYDAVLWAVEKEITTGTGDGTTFEPNAFCTRGQVITFLYRAYK